jgi:hypothetical protein
MGDKSRLSGSSMRGEHLSVPTGIGGHMRGEPGLQDGKSRGMSGPAGESLRDGSIGK